MQTQMLNVKLNFIDDNTFINGADQFVIDAFLLTANEEMDNQNGIVKKLLKLHPNGVAVRH